MPVSPAFSISMDTPDSYKELPETFERYIERKSGPQKDSQDKKPGTQEGNETIQDAKPAQESQTRRTSSETTILDLDLDCQSDFELEDEVFHDETEKSANDKTEKESDNDNCVVAESLAASNAIPNAEERMDTTMLGETLPEERITSEWKTQNKRNRKNNNQALMLALSRAEKLKPRPNDKPVTKRTTNQNLYKPPMKIGVKPHSSELLYNWTPNSKQLNNWREKDSTNNQRIVTRNLGFVIPKPWSAQENKGNRSFQRSFQQIKIIRFDDMNRTNKHNLEQALASGRWSEIKKSLKQLEFNRHCMTRLLSKQLSEWLEHGIYRAYLKRDHTKERFPVSLWPVSERGSRGCVTLADPVTLIPYLNYPALHTSLSGISAELLWLRLDRSERLRLLREAHGCNLRLNKKHKIKKEIGHARFSKPKKTMKNKKKK